MCGYFFCGGIINICQSFFNKLYGKSIQFVKIIAGIKFIGPSPENIRTMGDKIEAKRTAKALGIDLVHFGVAMRYALRLFGAGRAVLLHVRDRTGVDEGGPRGTPALAGPR